MADQKTESEKAMRRTAELGDTLLIAFFRDQSTLMKVISQLPYVELDPPHLTEREGTACQAISNIQLKDGTMGFSLITGGDLTSEEIRTAVDLLDKYGEEQIFAIAGESAKPSRVMGWLHAILGFLIILIGLIMVAVIVMYESDAFARDPLDALARMAICTLPFFVIGSVVLLRGKSKLRR